jgi:Sulfatase
LAVDLAVLVGVAGVAVTQPVLDLFGRNPTFFVAGGYERRQIVAFALVVAFVPALVAFVASALPGLVDRRVGRWMHGGAVAGFAGLFGLVVCRSVGVDGLVPALGVAVVMAVAVAAAEWRVRWARRFLSYLVVGNVAFVVLFLSTSPSAELLAGVSHEDAGTVRIPPLKGPVVVVVLDEFPLTSLLRADGSINELRYPNLAALARETTWFRNAASESTKTEESVPTILTGRLDGKLPILRDHPRNLFTLLGARYPVSRYELVTDLCPPELCARPGRPLRQALDDAWVVYQHRVLPTALRDGLPGIDHSWGNFGDGLVGDAAPVPEVTFPTTASGEPDVFARMRPIWATREGRARGQAGVLLSHIDLIGATPSLNFIHVALPHQIYELTPWGGINTDPWTAKTLPQQPSDPRYDFVFRELRAHQVLQIGAVDRMVGYLVDRLKGLGAWEEATVVITSDHGVDITPPGGFSREPTPGNMDELFRVPLFVKAPGETAGEVRDDPASTVDVLPSLVDLLDIDTEWYFDGHSLFDGSEPKIDRQVTSDVEAAFEVAGRHAASFPRGHGWDDLAAVGVAEDLVGQPVTEFEVDAPGSLSVTYDRQDLLANLDHDSGPVPYSLRGMLRGSDSTPPELVVALNGTLAGTIGGYQPQGGAWRFSGVMANYFVDGPNDVVAYQVERVGSRVVLHEVPSA